MAAADWHEEFADGLLSGPDAHFARNAGNRRGSGGAGGIPELIGAVVQRIAGRDRRRASAYWLVYDVEQFCGAQYVSQQAAQLADHLQYWVFAAVADAHDQYLARFLRRSGSSGSRETGDHARPR